MKKLKYCIVLILLSICSVLTYSQDTEVYLQIRYDLDDLFENLGKYRISSGFLKENAIDYVDLSLYGGGQINNNSSDLSTFENILKTLKSSSVVATSLSGIEIASIIEDIIEDTSESVVPVGVLAYKYNTFKENAINEGLVQYSNGKVSDVYDSNGNWKDPYDESIVIAFAPSRSIFNTGSVTLNFSDYLYTNLSISSIELDYGNGYVQVQGSINIYLNSSCTEFKLKITLDDGSVLYSTTDIYVHDVYMELNDIDTDITLYFSDSNNLAGYTSEAYVHVDLIDGNTSLTKPFIVVEGFDPIGIASLLGLSESEYGFCNIDTFRSTLSVSIR